MLAVQSASRGSSKAAPPSLAKEGGGSVGGKGSGRERLHIPLGTGDAVGEGELDIFLGKLHAVLPLEVLGVEGGGPPNDLNGAGAGAMTSGHLVAELGDGTGEGQIAVFAVHVVGPGAGGVAEPDSVIFDDPGVLLDDLDAVEDFSSGLLHLAELVHVVPELGFVNDGVRRKDDHAVCLGVGVFLVAALQPTTWYWFIFPATVILKDVEHCVNSVHHETGTQQVQHWLLQERVDWDSASFGALQRTVV